MGDLTHNFIELIRLTSTDLPPDIEQVLTEARGRESPGSAAKNALDTIL